MSQNAAIYVGKRAELVDYAARLVGSRALAEDLVQEAWLRYDSISGKHLVREPLNYLYRIVRNLALDRQRRATREARIFADIEIEVAAKVSTDQQVSPETEAIFKDEVRLLQEALALLPERTRIAFEMHRLGDSKLREIAGYLGISLSMAQVLVDDALEHCKQHLGWSK